MFAEKICMSPSTESLTNPLLAKIEEYAKKERAPVMPICAALEAQIADLPDEDKQAFLADMGRNRA